MEAALHAGIAIYNAGYYHAAHDAWEDEWLALDRETPDEQFLHGLIQFTAVVSHARERNWRGAIGLATSARGYLADLPADYRGVDVGAVRTFLQQFDADPERVDRRRPPALTHEGRRLTLGRLDFPAAAVAAPILADALEGFDADRLEAAVSYAREELDGATTRFVTLVMDFVADAERRDLVYQRLCGHVARKERRARDVEGLFD